MAGEDRQADFFNIVAWRNTAEFISKYFRKGVRVLVEGSLRNNDYEDNQGVRHYSVEIHAERVFFADGKVGQAQEVSQPEPEMDGFEPLESDDEIPFRGENMQMKVELNYEMVRLRNSRSSQI